MSNVKSIVCLKGLTAKRGWQRYKGPFPLINVFRSAYQNRCTLSFSSRRFRTSLHHFTYRLTATQQPSIYYNYCNLIAMDSFMDISSFEMPALVESSFQSHSDEETPFSSMPVDLDRDVAAYGSLCVIA